MDIGGAWALAMGFMTKHFDAMVEETTSGWGGVANPNMVSSLAMQKADAQVGAVLLTIGFAGQFASTFAWNPLWATTTSMVVLAAYIVTVGYLLLFLVIRPAYVYRALAAIPRVSVRTG